MVFTSVVPFMLAAWLAVDARLPANPSLDPVRDRLEQALRSADKQQLPTQVLLSKVREGVAKRVAPAALALAVENLAQHLTEAKTLASSPKTPSPSPALVQAIAEGRLAGLSESEIKPLLGKNSEAHSIDAINTLADLRLRGYEAAQVLPLLKRLLIKEPSALTQIASSLEVVRRDFALTNTETAQALDQSIQQKASLGLAVAQTRSDLGASAAAKGRSKAEKESGMSGRGIGAFPGQGRGPDKLPPMAKPPR